MFDAPLAAEVATLSSEGCGGHRGLDNIKGDNKIDNKIGNKIEIITVFAASRGKPNLTLRISIAADPLCRWQQSMNNCFVALWIWLML